MPENHKKKEIVTHSDNTMKANIKYFNIDKFNIDSIGESREVSRLYYLMNSDGRNANIADFSNKLIFFYFFSGIANQNAIKNYLLTLEDKLQDVFNIRETLTNLEDLIETVDRPINRPATVLLPRYKKMMRLRKFYENLIKFTLSNLHDFFWEDFRLLKRNTKSLEYYMNKIIPISIKIKEMYEKEIDEEFNIDMGDLMKMNIDL